MTRLTNDFTVPKSWDRSGLPGWAYFNEELLELEKEELFRKHWQIACHVSDVPEPGNFLTFDVGDERALIVRGRDGEVRAFHNLCRHRGSRVVAEERGQCKSALVCPYHGWAFNLDGTLRGAAQPKSFPPLDPVKWGLKPLDMEIWQGFVFIKFKPSEQRSVAEIMGRFDAELAPYEIEQMIPVDHVDWADETAVNWKAIRDVDNEGYHVAMAHPALHDLYGKGYHDEPFVAGASRSFAPFNEGPGALWSVRAYKSILPEATWLPESHRKAWLYVSLFPNSVIGVYPDSVIFYQEFPDGVGRSKLRGAVYRRRDESREMRAARYLSGRIDTITAEEDQMLTIWSCEAALSSAYDGIILSDLEYGVKTHHDHLRALFPVLNLTEEPAPGTLADINAAMLAQKGS
ncbi:MAG: aromatic ring-hydroxylating dioxygenase subunit alpha [Roseovarius sp.]